VWLTGERSCGVGMPPMSYPAGFVDQAATWLRQSLEVPGPQRSISGSPRRATEDEPPENQ
jgi:hypothetical protein